MCFEPDEYYEFYNESTHKARKPHKCDGCSREIKVSELYQSWVGKFDGRLNRGKTCGQCMATIYTLHVFELYEGCPDWTSWYPADLAFQEMRDHLRNVDDYAALPPKDRGEHGESLLHLAPIFNVPSREVGQRYLRMRTARNEARSAARRELIEQKSGA